MNAFLRPLIDSINELYHTGKYPTFRTTKLVYNGGVCIYILGVQISTPGGIQVAKAALILCSCDLPARALVLNMNQFNGSYGCHVCEDTGETERGKPLHRFWPYKPRSTLRTHNTLLTCAKEATASRTTVNDM